MNDLKELDIRRLIEAAQKKLPYSYSPYSNIRVGAAVLSDSREVYSGCNVENISYGLTICAERTAIFNAVHHGQRQIIALAVAVEGSKNLQINSYPCGACRQVMAEFMSPDAVVIIGDGVQRRLRELLPYGFATIANNKY